MAEGSPEFRRISDDSVLRRTGKGWSEWLEVLDECGAAERGHTASARHLRDSYGVSPWWAQAITVRYEYERGLRQPK
jgi:hypothetical protein